MNTNVSEPLPLNILLAVKVFNVKLSAAPERLMVSTPPTPKIVVAVTVDEKKIESFPVP